MSPVEINSVVVGVFKEKLDCVQSCFVYSFIQNSGWFCYNFLSGRCAQSNEKKLFSYTINN